MSAQADKLEQFNAFLAGIDLRKYRQKYAPIKLVELDLPQNIQAIRLTYELYWHRFELLDYDNFYARTADILKKSWRLFALPECLARRPFIAGCRRAFIGRGLRC